MNPDLMPAPSVDDSSPYFLREINLLDAGFIQKLTQTPGWLQYIGSRGTETTEGTYTYIQRAYTEAYAQHGYGLWGIILRGNQIPIGVCGLVNRSGTPAPDLGFALLPSYEGQGWVIQASKVVLAYATTHLKLKRVDAYANEDNVRSRKTLERLGFSLLQCSFQEAFGAIICHYSRMENDHTETVYDPIE